MFILTGSAVPPAVDEEDERREIRRTGTGRIARLTMRTMTLWENGPRGIDPVAGVITFFNGKTALERLRSFTHNRFMRIVQKNKVVDFLAWILAAPL